MMEFLTPYMDWLGVAAFFVIAFGKLADLTPNQTDNKIIDYARKLFSILGVKVPDIEKIEKK